MNTILSLLCNYVLLKYHDKLILPCQWQKGDNFVCGDGRGHGKLFTATVIDGNWRHAAKMNEARERTLQNMCSGLWAKPCMRMHELLMIDFVVGWQTDSILKNGERSTKSLFWGRWLFYHEQSNRPKKLCPNCTREVYHLPADCFELESNKGKRPAGWRSCMWRGGDR